MAAKRGAKQDSADAQPPGPARPADADNERGNKAHELIGGRLREARLRSGLGVRELSRKLDISASSISQIELGRVVPSVSTLYALTNALDISMDSLFVEDEAISAPRASAPQSPEGRPGEPLTSGEIVVGETPASAHERSFIMRRNHRRAIDLERGVRWELLTPLPEPGAEFLEVHYPVGGGSSGSGEAIRHNGRDYCLILEGTLSVQIGFEQYVLAPGDSMVFDGTIPHRLWNAGNIGVRAVWFVLDRWPAHDARDEPWRADALAQSPE